MSGRGRQSGRRPAAILVGGYTGSAGLLAPLAAALDSSPVTRSAWTAVTGHAPDGVPPRFDEGRFLDNIESVARQIGPPLVLLGHSTGGSLALLAATERLAGDVGLLVLAAAPSRIGGDYLERWQKLWGEGPAAGRTQPSLADVGRMASTVRRAAAKRAELSCPLLVVQGQEDELVPPRQARAWLEPAGGRISAPVRLVEVPGAGHDLFSGGKAKLAQEAVLKAVRDSGERLSDRERTALVDLREAEPELERAERLSFGTAARFVRSPGVRRRVAGSKAALAELEEIAVADPVHANVEVTTRCNCACPACARSRLAVEPREMPRRDFRAVLGLLPHAYRLTLVGLGEPALHQDLPGLVADARRAGRRVSIVTGGAELDRVLSRELLRAGLDGIAFSLDAADPGLAARVRPGAPLERVLANASAFVEESRAAVGRSGERPASLAVFTAISVETAEALPALAGVVADLGVDAWMLTDLNFAANRDRSLWLSGTEAQRAAVRSAVATAFRRGLPVLSCRSLEEAGLAGAVRDHLLLRPDELWRRAARHEHCLSPWQTAPVGVEGDLTFCDCRPEEPLGNLFERPLDEIWNGERARELRRSMRGPNPPEACRVCPRF